MPNPGDGLACEVCNPGTYIGTAEERCKVCADGSFSTERNAEKCLVCGAGMRAAKAVRYENLEKMPTGMNTRCERVGTNSGDVCAIHKGWIVANGGFTVLPYMPLGGRLILRTIVNVTKARGKMDFAYSVSESASSPETFKIRIDGQTSGILPRL